MVFFFFAMGHLPGLSSKNYEILPPQVKNHIWFIVIYLHCLSARIKLFKYIYFYTYTVAHGIE
jgi:hypothetical protein